MMISDYTRRISAGIDPTPKRKQPKRRPDVAVLAASIRERIAAKAKRVARA